MTHNLFKLLTVAAIIVTHSPLVKAEVPNHCRKDEVVYFSCKLFKSTKVISLCGGDYNYSASKEARPEKWLQYRFGKPGKLELVFPTETKGSLSHFEGERRFSLGVRLSSVSFTNGRFKYTVESSFSSETHLSFEGIRISESNEGKAVSLHCDLSATVDASFSELAEEIDRKPR